MNSKYDGYQKDQQVWHFFDKKTGSKAKANEVRAQKLQKIVIKKLKRK